MQNVSVAFVKLGQYGDAITSFEHVMMEEPNFRTGFNLILCYFALGDQDKMRRTFERLLSVDLKMDDEDKYNATPVSYCPLLLFVCVLFYCVLLLLCVIRVEISFTFRSLPAITYSTSLTFNVTRTQSIKDHTLITELRQCRTASSCQL